jgi:hypothetical protein
MGRLNAHLKTLDPNPFPVRVLVIFRAESIQIGSNINERDNKVPDSILSKTIELSDLNPSP